MQAVEPLNGVDHVALLLCADALGIANVVNRVALRAEVDALKSARQKAAVPLPRGDRLLLTAGAGAGEHDKPWQVFAVAPQAVPEPRAHARPAGDRRAGVHERVRRVVVDRLGHQRPHDADVVGDAADVRKERADLLSRLAVPLELVLRRQALELLILKLRDRLPLGERLRHRLAVHFGELRLVVERLQVRRSAGHVEVNHALCLAREVQRVDDAGPMVEFAAALRAIVCACRCRAEQRRIQ